MSRKGLFGLVVVIIIVVIAVTALMFLPREKPLKPGVTPEAEVIELREENTTLYALLYQMGLDPLVDVTDQRVLVRYNLPEEINEETYYRVLAYSARVAPNTKEIIIQIYRDYSPYLEVRTNTQDVLSWIGGEVSREEFSNRIRREAK